MARIHLPAPLREQASGEALVEVPGDTVAAAFEALLERHPRLRRHLFDDRGRKRGYVNVYLNERDVEDLDGWRTVIGPEDEISIVPSVAGGRSLHAAIAVDPERGERP